MVVSTRIVLSLLGVLGAIQAGLSYNLIDRYSASYAYPAFGVIVFLAFAVVLAPAGATSLVGAVRAATSFLGATAR
jgi:hypothetical protein